MLPVRGLLHDVVCPSFRDGECEKKRIGCVFSHDTSLLPVRPHQPEPEKRPVKKTARGDDGAASYHVGASLIHVQIDSRTASGWLEKDVYQPSSLLRAIIRPF